MLLGIAVALVQVAAAVELAVELLVKELLEVAAAAVELGLLAGIAAQQKEKHFLPVYCTILHAGVLHATPDPDSPQAYY